ncbi:MAG: hypothetical protein AB7N76_29890 [Planctomycetota bacterium]
MHLRGLVLLLAGLAIFYYVLLPTLGPGRRVRLLPLKAAGVALPAILGLLEGLTGISILQLPARWDEVTKSQRTLLSLAFSALLAGGMTALANRYF